MDFLTDTQNSNLPHFVQYVGLKLTEEEDVERMFEGDVVRVNMTREEAQEVALDLDTIIIMSSYLFSKTNSHSQQ